jgi:hypothetical protein
MRLVNNLDYRELSEGFFFKQVMDDQLRNDLFRKLYREGQVTRFYKWEIIGSHRAVGHFDCFSWYPNDPNRVEVFQGFVEKSLKDVYNPFGNGFTAVNYVYNAWSTAGSYSQWTVPGNWNDVANYMDVIGGGGHAIAYGSAGSCCFGGCGGGYARKNNSTLTKGSTLYIHPGAAGSSSWINNNSNTSPTSLTRGPLATGGGSGFIGGDSSMYQGSPGSGTYGDVKHTGGQGPSFTNYGATPGYTSGGGGAAGPNGNGGAGHYTNNGYSGGGGGNGGGTSASGTDGGDNKDGYGGGAATGGDGTYGGGAGGGGTSAGGNGGNGGNGTEYNNGAWGSGGGASGGYTAGAAGNYGAAAAGNCRTGATPNGAGGLAIIAYSPIPSFVLGGGSLLLA